MSPSRRPVSRAAGEVCGDCGEDLYFSGCGALTCDGWSCPECGDGCDLDFTGDDGICATEIREHVESNHSDASYTVTEDYIGDDRVMRCQCGTKLIWPDDAEEARELTEDELKSLRKPLPDLSALP